MHSAACLDLRLSTQYTLLTLATAYAETPAEQATTVADTLPAADVQPAAAVLDPTPAHFLIWSLGPQNRPSGHVGTFSLRTIIGLRYGPWRAGLVDSSTWHPFSQIKTDNELVYNWFDSARWRTALSTSIVNLQKKFAHRRH